MGTSGESAWEFEDELPRRKTRHDRMKTKDEKKETKKRPPGQKKGTNKPQKQKIPSNVKNKVVSEQKTLGDGVVRELFVGKCPAYDCGYKTYPIFSHEGAKVTLEFHVQRHRR